MTDLIKRSFKIVGLFLIPGIIIAVVYNSLINPVIMAGYPNMIALVLASIFALVPLLLVIILYSTKREYGSFSIKKAIKYSNPIAIKHYLWLVPALLLWAAAVFTLLKSFDSFIKSSLFGWIPENLILAGDFSALNKNQLFVSFVLVFLVVGIIGPVVEEIYFRGFLFPKMEWMGKAAPLVNAALFSLYHFWSPWHLITRFIAIYPLCYASYKTKNIKVAIVAHCLLNIFGDALVILLLYLRT